MEYILTDHAKHVMSRRGISNDWVRQVMARPDQILPSYGRRKIHQSLIHTADKTWLVRLVVEDWHVPPIIVTAYRTSNVKKYWRAQ